MEHGRDYSFSKPFFVQFYELMRRVPQPAVFNARTVNADYTQHTGDLKNGYLVSASWGGEDIYYSSRVHESKDCWDVFAVSSCELCHQDILINKSYRILFSQDSDNCSDSYFLFECRNCQNCFGCTNLRNKLYYIFNEPHTKDEYVKKIREFGLGSFNKLEELRRKFSELKIKALRKYANINNAQLVTGDNIKNANNCQRCFDVSKDIRDCKFIQNALQIKDSYDGYGVGASAELLYEVFDSGVQGSRLCFGAIIYGGTNVYYSYNCHGSSNLFGCVGLRNKQYCVLNKQYTPERYKELVESIKEHMNSMPYTDKKGIIYEYGEFFPSELSPFAYNETIAQEYFPLTKQQTIEKGYSWKDPEEKDVKIDVKSEDLPDHIKYVKDDITGKVIECQHKGECNEQYTFGFKIISKELEFYKKMNLPLPRLCPNCRHYQRIKQRNPLKLWKRKCMCQGKESGTNKQELGVKYQNTIKHFHGDQPCLNEFQTTYAPERPEIVYCERCYQQEVV